MSELTQFCAQSLASGIPRQDVYELLLIATHEEAGVDLPGC